MPIQPKLTLKVHQKPVEFTVEGTRLKAYDLLAQNALIIDGPTQAADSNRCFSALKESHLILNGNQLTILPKGFGGAGGKQEAIEIPDEYICPITHQLMYDPVIAADGETYEREAIERCLASNENSPLHGDILTHKILTPNRALKRTIDNFRKKIKAADEELYLPTSLVQNCQTAVIAQDLAKTKTLLQKEPRLFQHKFENNQTLLELSFQTTPDTVEAILDLYPQVQKPPLTDSLCAKISKALGHQGLQVLLTAYGSTVSFNTRLESAIAHKSIDYTKALLKLGADPSQANEAGQSPLHLAVDADNKAIISILLQNGADPKQPNTADQTPIEYATLANKPHLANHIAFQKNKLRVHPHLTPLQKQVDQLMSMQIATLQTLEKITNHLHPDTCKHVQQDINNLHQKLSTILATPATRPRPKRPQSIKSVQPATPQNIRQSDLVELLNQHFQDLDTLLRLFQDGDLKLGQNQQHTLILHYASAGLLMRIFHLLGIASNQKQLPQLFTDEHSFFERPTAYEYRGQLMHHLFKFSGCTLALINTAKALQPLSRAIQSLKNSGKATIEPEEISSLPIYKIARITEGIEDTVKDQLRATEDIDQYLSELAILNQQAQALKNKNQTLWQQAGLLHFAITTLSCALGQRLKDIAAYPAYQTLKNKLTQADPNAIQTTTLGDKTYTTTLFESDRLRFGHAYNHQNLAPGKANVEHLREKTFSLLTPDQLTQRLDLAAKLAPTRAGRQEPIPLFFQQPKSRFGFTDQQLTELSQALASISQQPRASSLALKPEAPQSPAIPEPAFGKAAWTQSQSSAASVEVKQILLREIVQPLPEQALGADAWAHLGDVGKEPPLPEDMEAILAEPCPAALGLERFGTTIGETHILVLIPATLNDKKLTLERFKTFLDSRDGPKITSWCPEDSENNHAVASYWALISKDCIQNSKNKTYVQQRQMVAQLGDRYRLPKVIEMTFGLYLQEVTHHDNLYANSWARCKEMHSYGRYPIACCGFGGGGGVGYFYDSASHDLVGVGVLRKSSF